MPALDTTGRASLSDLMDQITGAMNLGALDQPQSRPVYRRPSQASREREFARVAKNQQIRELASDVARTFGFTLRVSGSYPGGESYEDVLGYLADRGKDFLAVSPNMRRAVKAALLEEFLDEPRVPRPAQIQRVAGGAIIGIVVKRFQNRLRDVRIRANSSAYTRQKIKDGDDSRVGIRTGALLEAIQEDGRVELET